MIEAMPPSTAKLTRCRAVSPPKVLVTSTASKSALTPRSRAGLSLAQLTLSPSRGEDALRAEDHHEDEDEAEDHPLVLGGLELRGQARQVITEDRDAGVLELVEPERQPLEHLEIEHRHHGGADDRARDTAHAAEDHHGQHADGLEEGERPGIDDDLLGREDDAHDAGERGTGGEGEELGAYERHAHRLRGQLILAHGLPGASDVRVLQPAVDEDDHHDDEQDEEVEADRGRAV